MDRTVVSFNLSFGAHAALFAAYFFLIPRMPKTLDMVVSDVDLVVPARAAKAQSPGRPKPVTTWNFLKMALPQVKNTPSAQVKITTVDRRVEMPQPLKEQAGRLESKSHMRQMALSQKSLSLAEAAAKNLSRRQAVPLNAALDIEEIGARRAPNLPPDITMENKGLPSFKPQNLQQVQAFVAAQKSRPVGSFSASLPPEASGALPSGRAGQGSSGGRRISAPSLQLDGGSFGGGGRGLASPALAPAVNAAAASRPRREALKTEDTGRSAEISGPLSQRKIIRSYVPPFPDWAREKGILEALVSIRFYVSKEGRVLDGMQVERSSGYGALDRSAMETLKKWVFAPSSSGLDKEWGVITFRYIME